MHILMNFLQQYSYLGLFVALMLEYLFVPIPGETTLTAIGVLAPKFHWNVVLLILSTGLGSFIGSAASYFLGQRVGLPFLYRYGRFVFLSPARIDKASLLFSKYTVPTLLFSRYVSGVRLVVPVLAGIQRVPLGLYLRITFVTAFLWVSTYILAGQAMFHAGQWIIQHVRLLLH